MEMSVLTSMMEYNIPDGWPGVFITNLSIAMAFNNRRQYYRISTHAPLRKG